MLRTIGRLHDLFGGDVPARWCLLGLLVVLTTLVEAVAAGLVFVLVDLLATGRTTVPLAGQLSVQDSDLAPLGIGVMLLFVVRALLVLAHDEVLHRVCYGAGADLEERLLRAYLCLPSRELRRRGHAELVRNVHDTVMLVVEGALVPVVTSVGLVLRVASIGAVMVWVAPVPSGLAVALFAPALWLLVRSLRSPAQRLGTEIEQSLEDSLKVAGETLHLASEIRMAGRTDDFVRRFGDVRRRLARAAAREEALGVLPRLAAETLLVLFVIAYVGVSVARGDADTALPTLGLFAYSALRLLPSVVGVVGLVQSVRLTGPALRTLVEHRPLLASIDPQDSTPIRQPAPELIVLRGVTVRYDGFPAALREIDLELRRGDVVGVVGDNGSGKSTLLDVLSGQVVPVSGSVLLDGTPVATSSQTWLQHVGLVAQHVQLLDADVLTNVTLALGSAVRDEGKAHEVLRLVGAPQPGARSAAEAGPAPSGGPALGENGRLLSGGQRQKISLARALYRDVGLLLIDEGTSALDAAARAAVLAAIAEGSERRITVIVTHDPAVAATCTRVLCLTAGSVEEQAPAALPR